MICSGGGVAKVETCGTMRTSFPTKARDTLDAQVRVPSVSNSLVGGFPGWSNPIPTRYFRPIQPIEVASGKFLV